MFDDRFPGLAVSCVWIKPEAAVESPGNVATADDNDIVSVLIADVICVCNVVIASEAVVVVPVPVLVPVLVPVEPEPVEPPEVEPTVEKYVLSAWRIELANVL